MGYCFCELGRSAVEVDLKVARVGVSVCCWSLADGWCFELQAVWLWLVRLRLGRSGTGRTTEGPLRPSLRGAGEEGLVFRLHRFRLGSRLST